MEILRSYSHPYCVMMSIKVWSAAPLQLIINSKDQHL